MDYSPRAMPQRPDPPRLRSDRVVVITGGSSGIGLATAQAFAQRGWRVGLIARGAEGLAAAVGRLRNGPGSAAYALADVADPDGLEEAARQLERDLGPISVWINNAGISVFGKLLDVPDEEFRRVLDVTLLGTVNGTRTALRRMLPRRQGTIVNVGSLVAFRGAPLQTAYSAAKFGVRGFTEALRSELIHDRAGVHLAIVHPPSTNTPFFSHAGARMAGSPRPVPPVYQPELVAGAIWLAVSERRREVKVTGSTVQLALLNAALPGVMDRVLAWFGYPAQRTMRADVAQRRDPALFDAARNVSAAHGPFGSEALGNSTLMWAGRNRWAVGLGLTALFLATRPRRRRTG
jgi:NAD(P)-dependent dehydrogenase (short-subunit alcohol dehydrogenase family)